MSKPCRPPVAFFVVQAGSLPYFLAAILRVFEAKLAESNRKLAESAHKELPAALQAVPFGCNEMSPAASVLVGTAMFTLAVLSLCVVGCVS
jgi:hypothetical protein